MWCVGGSLAPFAGADWVEKGVGMPILGRCSFDIRGGCLYRCKASRARRGHAGVTNIGAIAQLGERYNGIVEVKGSSPFSSTREETRRIILGGKKVQKV